MLATRVRFCARVIRGFLGALYETISKLRRIRLTVCRVIVKFKSEGVKRTRSVNDNVSFRTC